MDDEFYEEGIDEESGKAEEGSAEEMMDDDAIDSTEEAFMKGYDEDAEESQKYEEEFDDEDLAPQE